MASYDDFPKIISVDDHVVEPATVWTDRLPRKYLDIGPRIVRRPVKEMSYKGGKFVAIPGDDGDEGTYADWWFYEDLRRPLLRLDTAVGVPRSEVTLTAITYDDMRPGSFRQKDRLDDMDVNWIDASLCFPTMPRFCGQTFTEATDRELGLLCIQAYNDWMVDEWCAGSGGRLVPLTIIPLWDAELAAAEVLRNAARGVRAVCFSELPTRLGLPSIHTREWDPFFAACNETDTVIHMHIGSSSQMPSTSADAPPLVSSTLTFANCCFSLVDWLMSGVFDRFPKLEIAYSEGQIGWIPYILERAEVVFRENAAWGGVKLSRTPTEIFRSHVYGCIFDDAHGLKNLDAIGEDRVTYESDYPHSDSTWPHTRKIAEEQTRHLTDEQIWKIMRGNAIRMLRLDLAR